MPLSAAAEPPPRGVRALAQPAHVPLTHPVVFHEDFAINPVPDGHRFPMPKDVLLHRRLTDLGLARRTFTPEYPQADTLCLAHTPEYVEQFLSGSISQQAMRQIGLAWSPELRQRTLIGVGSAVLAARLALQFGCAVMCNGGTHHAHPGHGSGTADAALLLCSPWQCFSAVFFVLPCHACSASAARTHSSTTTCFTLCAGWCIFNDLAVAARSVQRDTGLERCLFVDLDVHQVGTGGAALCGEVL